MKYSLLLLSIFLVTPAYSLPYSQDNKTDKTVTVDIATDEPTSLAAPRPPFSESAATELMEKVQALEERVQKLEKAVTPAKKAE